MFRAGWDVSVDPLGLEHGKARMLIRKDGSAMDEMRDWGFLVTALCEQIDKWPLAKWVTMEELAFRSPDIEFDEDAEKYMVAGAEGLLSPEDLVGRDSRSGEENLNPNFI